MLNRIAERVLGSAGVKVNGKNDCDIQINNNRFILRSLLGGSLSFGDAYARGDWDVKSIDALFRKLIPSRLVWFKTLGDFFLAAEALLVNTQSGKRAFSVAKKHYDLGNEMYELMLGESMTYSSALYQSEAQSLTSAQYNKYKTLCDSLELRRGMKVLEIGSGWGSFAEFAARRYGVEVVGLTVSKEQRAFAIKRCKGLKVTFLLQDYLKLPKVHNGKYDRVVSIEMIEAVGKKNFKEYFRVIDRVLKPDGRAGVQAILGNGTVDWFMSTRIFPNGLVPSMKQIIDASRHRLDLVAMKTFGASYARTLAEWEKNFSNNWKKISEFTDKNGTKKYDQVFYRMWTYYLLLCKASFEVGYIDVGQLIFAKSHMYPTKDS